MSSDLHRSRILPTAGRGADLLAARPRYATAGARPPGRPASRGRRVLLARHRRGGPRVDAHGHDGHTRAARRGPNVSAAARPAADRARRRARRRAPRIRADGTRASASDGGRGYAGGRAVVRLSRGHRRRGSTAARAPADRRSGARGHRRGSQHDAFVRALVDIAVSLHASPAELRERATTGTEVTSISRPRFDPYAARYGVRVGLGTTISYLIGIVADTAELFNVLWHPAFLAVSSYGATIRRAGTRFAGTVIGCLVAIVATIAVMPNISELPALALVLFAVTVPSAYVAVGGPRFSYAGLQIVVAFVIVALAGRPEADVHPALWRVYGTLLGTAALFLAFRFVSPDYAGRQLVARFTEIVREMLSLLPRPGSAPLTVAQAETVRQRIAATLPDILRLADEAQAEAATGGVDTQAAIVAGGRAVRIGYRLAAVYGERSANPGLPLSESP